MKLKILAAAAVLVLAVAGTVVATQKTAATQAVPAGGSTNFAY